MAVEAAPVRPNIVLMIADDLGYGDLGCYGGSDIPTPRLDALAKQGMRFTRAYAYPVCTPTRAAILTGQYAERHGFQATKVLMGDDNRRFAAAVTFAERLRESGYRTGLVGKWHLGYSAPMRPTDKGFDEFFGQLGGKMDYYQHTDTAQKNGTKEGSPDLWEGDRPVRCEGYVTDLVTERARRFLSEGKDRPFFLMIAFNNPHYAYLDGKRHVLQAPRDYLEKFGVSGRSEGRGVYAAMVNKLDDAVGQIIDTLDARGLAQNTVVVFMSDNGGDIDSSNLPLRGAKRSTWEGGIRVSLIARWPGHIPAGGMTGSIVSVLDFAPTFLAWADSPAMRDVDGADLREVFRDPTNAGPHRSLFIGDAVIEGRWKLKDKALYNLADDIGEKRDVSAQYPEIVEHMSALRPPTVGQEGKTRDRPAAASGRQQPSRTTAILSRSHFAAFDRRIARRVLEPRRLQ